MSGFRRRAIGWLVVLALCAIARAQDVTIQEDDAAYTMSNGIVTAKIAKQSGDLVSLQYKQIETLEFNSGHPGGYWSHGANSPNQVRRITIDPRTNGGQYAEVSVKGISGGRRLGRPAGLAGTAEGDFAADIEIRYAMARGVSGVYTYCTFDHKPDYPDSTMGEARYCIKLADVFDWMLVDEHHNQLYPRELEANGDNKYNYTTVQYDHRAFGWASTSKNIGLFIVNASVEYLTGPPTKVEFEVHRDTTGPVYAPCILNYWRSSHYGGASVDVAQGEQWTKVVGPFLLYANSAADTQTIWKDANEQVAREQKKWPYEFVAGVDYPLHNQRGTVTGQLVLNDPLMPGGAKMSKVMVGVTHPDYTIPLPRPYQLNSPRDIDWRTDARHYSFWTQGEDNGKFSIPDVRPGKYTFHAFATGVLGEFAKADVTVEAGKTVDLGRLDWKPVRRGKQIWEVGIPNRTGREYVKGEDYFHNRMDLVYAELFPNDINYVIGKSDFRKDWFYLHVPHPQPAPPATAPALVAAPPTTAPVFVSGGAPTTQPGRGRGFGFGARGRGPTAPAKPTPWTITFDMPSAPRGKATLRFGIATNNTPVIEVSVNNQPAGKLENLPTESSIGRNGVQGLWFEREVAFDASMMKAGINTLTITVPAGGPTAGVIYDYLRLELDEASQTAMAR